MSENAPNIGLKNTFSVENDHISSSVFVFFRKFINNVTDPVARMHKSIVPYYFRGKYITSVVAIKNNNVINFIVELTKTYPPKRIELRKIFGIIIESPLTLIRFSGNWDEGIQKFSGFTLS